MEKKHFSLYKKYQQYLQKLHLFGHVKNNTKYQPLMTQKTGLKLLNDINTTRTGTYTSYLHNDNHLDIISQSQPIENN